MLKIGVAGDKSVYDIIDIISTLHANALNKGIALEITPVCTNNNIAAERAFDILVINSSIPLIHNMAAGSALLVNSDDKEVMDTLSVNRSGLIITYGFNGKACVTASSISENSCSVCVQRAFQTLNGATQLQQEFKVSDKLLGRKLVNNMISAVLAASAAAMVGDFFSKFSTSLKG